MQSGMTKEQYDEAIKTTKELRVEIDGAIQSAKAAGNSRALSLVVTKLEEAKMWAGKRLEELGSELPAEYRDQKVK